MDPKASAKAKRSHTQQGRKSHPTPASIAQKKKAAQGGSDEKVRRPHSQTLLPNWDRYDQREEEDDSKEGKTLPGGEIAPKSKGADFGYLIEQARSQPPETKASAAPETLPFFDGLTLDFMQAVSSVRTVRGKALLSRCEDDNFVVDDDFTSTIEVPFLNLDLHALAAQLSKTKILERLFLEDDLFPEDLLSDELKDDSSPLQSETRVIDHRSSQPEDDVGKAEDHNMNVLPHSDLPIQILASEAEASLSNMNKSSTISTREAEAELDFLLKSFEGTNPLPSIEDDLLDKPPAPKLSFHDSINGKPVTDSINGKPQIEAELDDLLDSSTEISSSSSIHGSLLDNRSTFKARNSDFLLPIHRQSSIQDRVSIEDSLDVLLAETSPITKMQNHPDPQLDMDRRPPPSSSSSADGSFCNVSAGRVQKYIVSTNAAGSSVGSSSMLGSIDVIDDFDSWIDTL